MFITDQYPEQFREFKSSYIRAANNGSFDWDSFYIYIFGA